MMVVIRTYLFEYFYAQQFAVLSLFEDVWSKNQTYSKVVFIDDDGPARLIELVELELYLSYRGWTVRVRLSDPHVKLARF
jgi:hypothetical protein